MRMVKGLQNLAAMFSQFSSPSGVDIDVAYISRIRQANLLAALNFGHERIVLLVILEIFVDKYCVQNEPPRNNFLNILKDSLLAVANLF
jgi:hypothetical protein